MSAQTPVPGLLRGFFEDYLAAQRDVSQNTIYADRDAIKLFLRFAARHRGRQLLRLQLADLGADTVLAFLTHLESDRNNSAATRNCRLVAIHRLFAYAADQDPRHAQLCRRVLDIPLKKTTSNSMTHLNQDEVKALLAAPPARHRLGLRDRALLTLLCNTGARATEVVQLNIKGLRLETPSQVRILGKGRKERVCPLWQETSDALRAYLRQRADGAQPDAPLFLNAHGERITRFGVGTILKRNVTAAAATLPSLAAKPVSPHTLRHTTVICTEGRGVASDATFRSPREHALPAAQRAALRALGLPGLRRGRGDLGFHGPPGSDATMMQLIPLHGPHHHCACWHRDAFGSSRMHRVHHHLTQREVPGRRRSCEGRAGPPPSLATSRVPPGNQPLSLHLMHPCPRRRMFARLSARPSATRHAAGPTRRGRGRHASQSPPGRRSWPGPATWLGRPHP